MTFSAETVQRGTVLIPDVDSNTTFTVALTTPVPADKFAVNFSVPNDGVVAALNRPARRTFIPRLTLSGSDVTHVVFTRGTDAGSRSLRIDYEFIEFTGDVTCEHVEILRTTGTQDTNVSVDVDRCLVFTSWEHADSSTSRRGMNYGYTLGKTGAQSYVRLEHGTFDTPGFTWYLTLVQFDAADIENYARGSTTLPENADATAAIGFTPVLARTLAWQIAQGGSSTDDSASVQPGVRINGSNIELERDDAAGGEPVSMWTVLQLAGLDVQRGSLDPGANTTGTVSISSVDTAQASVNYFTQPHLNQHAEDGATSISQEELWFGWRLTDATTLTYERGTGTDFTTHDLRWLVVEWPVPAAGGGAVVDLPLLASATADAQAPAIATGAAVGLPAITSASSGEIPAPGTGAALITAAGLAESTPYAISVETGASVPLPALQASSDPHPPVVATGVNVALVLVSAASEVYPPDVTAGAALEIFLPTSLADSAPYPPAVGGGANIALPVALADSEAYAITVAAGGGAALPALLAESQAHPPAVGGGVLMVLPAVLSESAAVAPGTQIGASVALPVLQAQSFVIPPQVGDTPADLSRFQFAFGALDLRLGVG